MGDLHGWEATERMLESGGFGSRQRCLCRSPPSRHPREAPAGSGRHTGGPSPVSHGAAFARPGATGVAGSACWAAQPCFGSALPSCTTRDGVVSCGYAIEGGLLALRAGGSVTLAQRRERRRARAERHRRGIPAAAGRARPRTEVDRRAVCEGAKPVPRRGEPALLRAARPGTGDVRVTVLGATGVIGQALLPLLADRACGRRRLAPASRRRRRDPLGRR